MSGWLLICFPVVAAAVATGHAVKPRPRLHAAPKPARPVAAAPHVPDAITRPRPRVVKPRVRLAPAIECRLVRVPPWLADAGGYAPGWWPGYAPVAGAGSYYAPVLGAGVSYGGGWGFGPSGGGWPGGWIVTPGGVVVAGVEFSPGTNTAPGPDAPPGETLAPGPIPPGVVVTTGILPPGAVPPEAPRPVPAPPGLAVVAVGLAALAAARKATR